MNFEDYEKSGKERYKKFSDLVSELLKREWGNEEENE